MKYKIGDIVEVNLSPKKGYSQKTPSVTALKSLGSSTN